MLFTSLAEGVGTFFPYKVTCSLKPGSWEGPVSPARTVCSHSPSVPVGILDSLEYVGPLMAMLFCHLPHFTFPRIDCGKSSDSFQISFGSTGFQQCDIAVSYISISPASWMSYSALQISKELLLLTIHLPVWKWEIGWDWGTLCPGKEKAEAWKSQATGDYLPTKDCGFNFECEGGIFILEKLFLQRMSLIPFCTAYSAI